jgi:hypothetical protein
MTDDHHYGSYNRLTTEQITCLRKIVGNKKNESATGALASDTSRKRCVSLMRK